MSNEKDIIFDIDNEFFTDEKEEVTPGIQELCQDNVVTKDKLRKIQGKTLDKLANFISATYGPLGSNTMIVSGNNKETIKAEYSKDGLKVLKNITFNQPLEMAIHSEIEEIARFVEHQVGDGTTSSVIVSAKIFKGLSKLEKKYNISPQSLVWEFNKCVENIQKYIKDQKRDITEDNIYDICLISTNGNSNVADTITQVYKEYGFDVNIDVGISNDTQTKLVKYDGLTVNSGYSDPAYINNENGTAAIRGNQAQGVRVYSFTDPIDTPEMIGFMEKIIMENIIIPAQDGKPFNPTVIASPKISRDASGLLSKLVTLLYSYNKDNSQMQKPPILIMDSISGTDEGIFFDIAKLCRCKEIKKYIDPKIQKADQEKGEAPTIDNVVDWYGTADEVIADQDKTKFINPACMVDDTDNTYEVLVNWLQTEIKKATENNDDHLVIGRLKKRLRCLQANMVEYLIGGISVSDRDSLRDLVEDAVKNCASAAENGVGYAANFEGLRASHKFYLDEQAELEKNDLKASLTGDIYKIIYASYFEAARILYSSVIPDKDEVDNLIFESIEIGKPFNIADIESEFTFIGKESSGESVLCSINTDIEILNAISRIITIMVTANQSLVQTPALNRY